MKPFLNHHFPHLKADLTVVILATIGSTTISTIIYGWNPLIPLAAALGAVSMLILCIILRELKP